MRSPLCAATLEDFVSYQDITYAVDDRVATLIERDEQDGGEDEQDDHTSSPHRIDGHGLTR